MACELFQKAYTVVDCSLHFASRWFVIQAIVNTRHHISIKESLTVVCYDTIDHMTMKKDKYDTCEFP